MKKKIFPYFEKKKKKKKNRQIQKPKNIKEFCLTYINKNEIASIIY